VNIKDVKDLLQVIKDFDLSKFEIAEGDFKLSIERGQTHVHGAGSAPAVPVVVSHGMVTSASVSAANAAQSAIVEDPGVVYIKSPIVGTFYRSPSPERPSFVEVKSKVSPDTVVCIIEAMKVMNEVLAEVKGTIEEILVEGGKPIEYGQPLFKVRVDKN
jgi:acetyl-CoA carboxylase biotin carboxyl carrier protein